MLELDSINFALINIIRIGAVFRIVYLSLSSIFNSDLLEQNNQKIKYTILCYILCELAIGIKDFLVDGYYS